MSARLIRCTRVRARLIRCASLRLALRSMASPPDYKNPNKPSIENGESRFNALLCPICVFEY
jgi:hypothetical protein